MRGAVCLVWLWATACAHAPVDPLPLGRSPYIEALRLPAGTGSFQPESLRGRVVLVTFFTTWCFPCLGQFPVFRRLHEQHLPDGLTVVAVGLDLEGRKVLAPFAELYNFPFPLLVADDLMRQGQSAYGAVAAVPTTVLLSRSGKVVGAFQGLVKVDELEAYLKRELSQPLEN